MRLFPLIACFALLFAGRAHADGERTHDLQVSRGRKLLDMQGCTACHSLDGSISAGPTFLGRFNQTTEVLVAGKLETVRFDADYIRESVENPSRAVTKGFASGVMPRFTLTEEQLSAITAALADLGTAAPPSSEPSEEPAPIRLLAVFVLLFVAGHLTLSSTPVRGPLVRAMGQRGYQGAYALLALASFVGMVWAYREAPYLELWPKLVWTRYVPLATMPISLFFFVCGSTTKTPTQVGPSFALAYENAAVGILRITRHPQLWSYALWSLSHIPPNGDAASLLFFGAFGALSMLGMVHIEHRRAAAHGEDWKRFAAQTSLVPFEAIVEGRNELVLAEIGWWRVALSLGLYVMLLLGHGHLFGASPWP